MKKHPPLSTLELINTLRKAQVIVLEKLEGHGVRGECDGVTIRLSKRYHRSTDAQETGLAQTLIHEAIHMARPQASERWCQRQDATWYRDDKVLLEAFAKLVRIAFFEESKADD